MVVRTQCEWETAGYFVIPGATPCGKNKFGTLLFDHTQVAVEEDIPF